MEEGEIAPPPRAAKYPKSSDPPPEAVREAAKRPADLSKFATRSDPKEKEVYTRPASPPLTASSKILHRLPGNYKHCVPATSKFILSCYHGDKPKPTLIGIPDDKRGIMDSEDNALAAAQAIATSMPSDRQHYMGPGNEFQKDWMQKDAKIHLARALVAIDMKQKMSYHHEQRAYDNYREVKDLQNKRKSSGPKLICTRNGRRSWRRSWLRRGAG
ncbi:hypothetical protein Dimus_037891 [Dionaea muscipula]